MILIWIDKLTNHCPIPFSKGIYFTEEEETHRHFPKELPDFETVAV